MWPDNETATDFLNFSGIADTVAEIVVQADGRPISIGVSGAWGVGKSSMIRLIRTALAQRDDPRSQGFVFVEFNAWLYQGFDDARAALLEVIASSLVEEAEKRKSGVDRAKDLLSRVNWLRVGAAAASSVGVAFGIPPVGLAGEAIDIGRKLIAGKGESPDGHDASSSATRPSDESSPPKQIHAIRESLECTLSEMNVTLVVLIDDLDRCLPPTTISTLEAIRLFLFLQNTAFVVAADDTMIKHAVRRHFDDVGEELATNYFDKLIQVPIRVPPLGTQEVRAYMMLLFVEDSSLSVAEKEGMRASVCEQLSRTWRGHRVDRAFMETLHDDLPNELRGRLDTADRLASLMTTTSQIGGNPRLIKRFLNALAVRMAISRAHGVGVDEAVLAKILLFERCAAAPAYDALTKQVNDDAEGKPRFLGPWEEGALAGEEMELSEPWDDSFISEWLTVSPPLADTDLRGVLYVSREHAPLITAEDRLSSEGAELLNAVLEHPDMAGELLERLTALPRPETTIIMDRILERARQFQEWGAPPILDGALAIATADPLQGQRLAAFLSDRPVVQVRPNIVPKIGDQPWAAPVLDAWYDSAVASPVKAAITRERKNRGHV